MKIHQTLIALSTLAALLTINGCGISSEPTFFKTENVDDNKVDVERFTQHFNEYRSRNGRQSVRIDQQLIENARQNNIMQQQYGLGHHYMGRGTRRQNSAWNYGSIESVMTGWHNSSGHNVNLNATDVNCYGIHWLGAYWTMDLGSCP
jgi:uncharacterized protein YkwD